MAKAIDEIIEVHGTSFVGFDTETVVKLTGGKSNPLQNCVTKRSTGMTGMIYSDKESSGYENKVNAELRKLGITDTFKSGKSRWGKKIPGTPFVEHNENKYIQIILIENKHITKYYVNGIETDKDKIEGLPKAYQSKHGVRCKRYNFDSITHLRFNKREYTFYRERVTS
jgi:hypothetical protein